MSKRTIKKDNTMIQRLLMLFVLFISINTLSQIPDNYYQTANGKTGYELKTALYDIIKGHTDIGYSGLWTAYPKTDSRNGNEVWDIYSDVPGGTPAYIYIYYTTPYFFNSLQKKQ